MDTVKDVTDAEDLNVLGFCAGGIISAGVLNHLAASPVLRTWVRVG
jgi:polyhydroxyalkanoate synthase